MASNTVKDFSWGTLKGTGKGAWKGLLTAGALALGAGLLVGGGFTFLIVPLIGGSIGGLVPAIGIALGIGAAGGTLVTTGPALTGTFAGIGSLFGGGKEVKKGRQARADVMEEKIGAAEARLSSEIKRAAAVDAQIEKAKSYQMHNELAEGKSDSHFSKKHQTEKEHQKKKGKSEELARTG